MMHDDDDVTYIPGKKKGQFTTIMKTKKKKDPRVAEVLLGTQLPGIPRRLRGCCPVPQIRSFPTSSIPTAPHLPHQQAYSPRALPPFSHFFFPLFPFTEGKRENRNCFVGDASPSIGGSMAGSLCCAPFTHDFSGNSDKRARHVFVARLGAYDKNMT